MSSASVGFMTAALDLAVKYAREREPWGKKIGEHQLVQEMIFDMKAQTETCMKDSPPSGRGASLSSKAGNGKLKKNELVAHRL